MKASGQHRPLELAALRFIAKAMSFPKKPLTRRWAALLADFKARGRIGGAIVNGRPYRSPDELLHKHVLTRATFEQIRGQIIVQ